jgi:hypothetical protein
LYRDGKIDAPKANIAKLHGRKINTRQEKFVLLVECAPEVTFLRQSKQLVRRDANARLFKKCPLPKTFQFALS